MLGTLSLLHSYIATVIAVVIATVLYGLSLIHI